MNGSYPHRVDNSTVREIKRAISLVDVVGERLELHKNGRGYKGLCPFHPEDSPSFHVYDSPDDRHYHCFGCREHGDLFTLKQKLDGGTFPDILKWAAHRAGVALPDTNGHQRSVARTITYTYKVGNGSEVARHTRREDKEGKKLGDMPWSPAGIHTSELPLYRLPELLETPLDEAVILAEGEKACDTLRERGLVAVSLAGGASQKNFGTALEALHGRTVYLWPDNDSQGEELMERVGIALQGIASEVRVLRPGSASVQPKDDAFDYFAAGGSIEQLCLMMKFCPLFTAPGPAFHSSPHLNENENENAGSSKELLRVWEHDEPARRREAISGLVYDGSVTALYGDGGQGKSYLALCLATHSCLGKAFAGRTVDKRPALYLDGELDSEEFIRRAYQLARGMGMSRPPEGLHYYQLPGPLHNPTVQALVTEAAKKCKAGLIILDSLTMSTYDKDAKEAGDTIAIIKYLETLGAVIAIDHISKPQAGSNLSNYRQYGSVFKGNGARSVIQVMKAEGGGLALLHKKTNFGPKSDPIYLHHAFVTENNSVTFTNIEAGDASMAGIDENMPAMERVYRDLSAHPSGRKVEEIAAEIDLKPGTVSNHLTALKKSGRAASANGIWTAIHFHFP